jgi:hypothetical protein
VLLDILDDVFLLDLSLESAEGTFNGLALLNLDFSHAYNTPSNATFGVNMLGYHEQARILGAIHVKVNEIVLASGHFLDIR